MQQLRCAILSTQKFHSCTKVGCGCCDTSEERSNECRSPCVAFSSPCSRLLMTNLRQERSRQSFIGELSVEMKHASIVSIKVALWFLLFMSERKVSKTVPKSATLYAPHAHLRKSLILRNNSQSLSVRPVACELPQYKKKPALATIGHRNKRSHEHRRDLQTKGEVNHTQFYAVV